jgi:archaea-specific DNA-binding protein
MNKEKREIFVGNKPFMKYVIATITQLKKSDDVAVIKARGKFISRGVDIAEVTKKRMKETENLELKHSIQIGTEEFENEKGEKINVSTISIELKK